jgi:hypothetical protein
MDYKRRVGVAWVTKWLTEGPVTGYDSVLLKQRLRKQENAWLIEGDSGLRRRWLARG